MYHLELDEIRLLVHFFFENITFEDLAGRRPKAEEAANTTH